MRDVTVGGPDECGDFWLYSAFADAGFHVSQPELNALHAALSAHVSQPAPTSAAEFADRLERIEAEKHALIDAWQEKEDV